MIKYKCNTWNHMKQNSMPAFLQHNTTQPPPINWMLCLTFRRHTQVGHDNQHRVRLDPEDIAGHIFIIQRFSCGDDACPVVHLKMT